LLMLALLILISSFSTGHTRARPHILYILADDFGWANADWHRSPSHQEKATPFLNTLVKEGVELDRMYSFKFCSPSRSAIQSGRNPIHVNVQNLDPTYANKDDTISGYAGIPTEMTGMGAVMQKAGYSTHFVGKWDAGMATPQHTPQGRGYDTSLVYFHHLNDYWDQRFYGTSAAVGDTTSVCRGYPGYDQWRPVDLWQGSGTGLEGPARGRNNSLKKCTVHYAHNTTSEYCFPAKNTVEAAAHDCPAYPPADASSDSSSTSCSYEDAMFENEVFKRISEHNASQPLFLFWSFHVLHAPLQVPKQFLDLYAHIARDDWRRQRYLAMTRYMDAAVKNVTRLLEQKKMYKDTVIVFSSDNGGPIYRKGSVGASNFPLRGGKASNWEGGVRVNAFVSGGFVPTRARGRRLSGLGAVWDWYGTFAALAAASPLDTRALAAGLPPVDSVDLWPYVAGEVRLSPRKEIALGSSSCVHPGKGCINEWGDAPSLTVVDGLIQDERSDGGGLWKLLVGQIPMDGW
jgi:arylsulfatase I/J